MSDYDPEQAFLLSMQNDTTYSPNNYQDAPMEEDEESDYDPSSIDMGWQEQHATKDTSQRDALQPESIDSSSNQSPALSAAPSMSVAGSQIPSRTSSTVPAPTATAPVKSPSSSVTKPRTIGGFAADDSDDEDAVPPFQSKGAGTNGQSVLGGSAQSQSIASPLRSVTQTPNITSNNASSSQNVLIKDGAAADASAREETSAVADQSSASLSNAVSGAASSITPQPQSSSLLAPPAALATVELAEQPSNSGHAANVSSSVFPRQRLPTDVIGILEDRIVEDSRGDLDAWLSLISEYKKRNRFDDARAVWERFFTVFPTAAEQWVAFIQWELQNNEFARVDQLFGRSLLTIPNVNLWSTYLDYIRRRHNLNTDSTGQARQTISQAYEFTLDQVGIDKDSGILWRDYIDFLKGAPGSVGGTGWQDQQKMDTLRKAYQKAVANPMGVVQQIWKEYNDFEMGLNKITGRKFLQERSPAYMTARAAYTQVQNKTLGLNRTSLPRLPPAFGFEGDTEYMEQVRLWREWISWEKEDPLVLKEEDLSAYNKRIVYVFKQAVQALRFWPEIWCEAADFCYENDLEKEGTDFLAQAAIANPESCLIAFKRADRIEMTTANLEGTDAPVRRGKEVRDVYEKLFDALYDLINKTVEREKQALARAQEAFDQYNPESPDDSDREEDDDDDDDLDNANNSRKKSREAALNGQLDAIKAGSQVQIRLLSRTVSTAWVALMRAMRRIQGKGKLGDPVGGSRQIFADARKRGRLTSDAYIAAAMMEYHCYKDPAGVKIFDRGLKLFPEDEVFALAYLKHLIAVNDITNARAVFSTTVHRLTSKPQTAQQAKPLYAFFHDYESQYGELTQVRQLEDKMAKLFPNDPKLHIFSSRFVLNAFDPTAIRPIISPITQARPKPLPLPSVERPISAVLNSPRPPPGVLEVKPSPKRPYEDVDSDRESATAASVPQPPRYGQPPPPKRLQRGESPLKGAAGRRLEQRMAMKSSGGAGFTQPASLPREVNFLLGIIPNADKYPLQASRFDPVRLAAVLRGVDLNRAVLTRPNYQQGYGAGYGNFR